MSALPRCQHEHSANVSGRKCPKEAQRSCGLDFCIVYSPGPGAGAGCWTQVMWSKKPSLYLFNSSSLPLWCFVFLFPYHLSPFFSSAPVQQGLLGSCQVTKCAVAIMLVVFCSSRELLGGEESWPLLLASNLVPALIQLTALPWFPESPRYLLIDRGDEESCISGELRAASDRAPGMC